MKVINHNNERSEIRQIHRMKINYGVLTLFSNGIIE